MTTRYSAFIVVLESNLRDDDANDTLNAIRQIKGVASVQPHEADISIAIASARAKHDIARKLWKVLDDA